MDTEDHATAPSDGIGGGEDIPPPDPKAPATAATNGAETAQATGPEAAATAETNGTERTHLLESPDHQALHEYAARYSSRSIVARMLFISCRCTAEVTEVEALKIALRELKKGTDVLAFEFVCDRIGRLFDVSSDQEWRDSVSQDLQQSLISHQADLKTYLESQLPNQIREGYWSLGNLYYSHGYIEDAFDAYKESEKYITSSTQLTQLCFFAILINIERGHFDQVLHYVAMAKRSLDPLDAISISKLHASAGLAYLRKRQYKLAALQFLEVGIEIAGNYSDVIAPEDVATYGALCALATFSSIDIKTRVLDNTHFAPFLALVPDVWQLINNFYSSQHTLCLESLDKLRSNLLLDIYISAHVETLYLVITQKSEYVGVDLFQLDELLRSPSPAQHEGESEADGNSPVPNVRSNLVLPDNFNDDLELASSNHYSFVKCKDLLDSLGTRSLKWVSRLHSFALLLNADIFVVNSAENEKSRKRVDGRTVLVSDEKYRMFEVEFSSYTTTGRTLKEKKLTDKESSLIDRFEMKGDKWIRRRICLRGNTNFHLLQWKRTASLRRVQVLPLEAPPENSRDKIIEEMAATMKKLTEQLQATSKNVVESSEETAKSRQAIVEACEAAVAAMRGGGMN